MTRSDGPVDERDQVLKQEIRAAFGEISMSADQLRRLHVHFARHISATDRDSAERLVAAANDSPPDDPEMQVRGESSTRRRTPRHWASRGLERAAVVLLALLLIGGLFVARTLAPSDGSAQPGANVPIVTTVYAVQQIADGEQLLSLDPTTLANKPGHPIPFNGPWAVSGDGSTVVSIEYGQKAAGQIVVRNGFSGTERARFDSPKQGLFLTAKGWLNPLQLNFAGTRLLINDNGLSDKWSVIDLANGKLLSTITGVETGYENVYAPPPPDQMLLSPDGKRVYRVELSQVSATAGASAPLQIIAYDASTGQQAGQLMLPDVRVGTWQGAGVVPGPQSAKFPQPATAISPDNQQIAVATGNSFVTLIDASTMKVERTLSPAQPTSFNVKTDAVYAPDGGALYVWGWSSTAVSASSAKSAVSLERIALATGKTVVASASSLADSQIERVEPSPDGKSIYVLGDLPSMNSSTPAPASATGPIPVSPTRSLWRLDAQTLQVEAQRSPVGMYGMALVTGEPQSSAPTRATPNTSAGMLPASPGSGNPEGLTLQLSQTTVNAGEVVTRTITGAGSYSDLITGSALILESNVSGSWRDIYYMGLGIDGNEPIDWTVGPGHAMNAAGYPPSALQTLIPNVPPGNYRVRQDLNYVSGIGATKAVTLYATITVVAP